MSAQVYSVPGQTEGRKKAFLKWASIDVSSKLSLACGGYVNYYKSAHHSSPARGDREYPGNSQSKLVNSPFNWMSRYILFLAKLKGRGRNFLKGARRGATLWNYPQEHLVVIRDERFSPFVKFEMILSLLCVLLESLKNKHCRTWSSMIIFWIDSKTWKFFMLWFYKILKSIFQKQPPCLKNMCN